jgi:hypothetical protein
MEIGEITCLFQRLRLGSSWIDANVISDKGLSEQVPGCDQTIQAWRTKINRTKRLKSLRLDLHQRGKQMILLSWMC